MGLCALAWLVERRATGLLLAWPAGTAIAASLRGAGLPAASFAGYALLGVAGWRIWMARGPGPMLVLWGWQLLLAAIWAPVMVATRLPWAGALALAACLCVLAVFVWRIARADRLAVLMTFPYVGWIGFVGVAVAHSRPHGW